MLFAFLKGELISRSHYEYGAASYFDVRIPSRTSWTTVNEHVAIMHMT